MPICADFSEIESLLKRYAPASANRPTYTLEHMLQFMDFLGNPQDKLNVIHVAGTSGKTSTSYYIASLLKETGKKVGLSISPYVHEVNERVQIGLNPLPERIFCDKFAIFLELVGQSNIELTRFELLIAFAYWEFARQDVDYVVMEVGLGGELDATNVISRQDKVCIITDIGLDHQDKLGNTLGEIAHSKAGIIQLHNRVFTHEQPAEVMTQIVKRAKQKQADLYTIPPPKLPDNFDFLPLFQRRNFGLALAVVQSFSERDGIKHLNDSARLRAARVSIPARMETHTIGGKTVILDGAHNEQKLAALAVSLRHRYGDQPIAVLAAFKAKQHDRLEPATQVLTGLAHHIIATTYGDPGNREPYGEDPDVISALCKTHGFWEVEAVTDPAHAWRQLLARPEPILLVTGSFYLFNDIYPILK